MPSLVLIVSALFAMSSRIGQMQIVSRATRMTGASDVMADDALGWALRKFCSGLMKPAMLVKLVKAQNRETGKIYPRSAKIESTSWKTHPDKGEGPNTEEDDPTPDEP